MPMPLPPYTRRGSSRARRVGHRIDVARSRSDHDEELEWLSEEHSLNIWFVLLAAWLSPAVIASFLIGREVWMYEAQRSVEPRPVPGTAASVESPELELIFGDPELCQASLVVVDDA